VAGMLTMGSRKCAGGWGAGTVLEDVLHPVEPLKLAKAEQGICRCSLIRQWD
jgi:hypothetical protein